MKILILTLAILLTSCATDLFDTPYIDVPFIVLDVNESVNQTPYLDDEENYGQEDYWATPKEFNAKGRGDCEDYAITKYFSLRKAGIPANRMVLSVIEIDDGDSTHMVLLVRYKETFVLDNIVERVTPIKEYLDFELLYNFNENHVYIAGMRVSTAVLPKWQSLLKRMQQGE